MRFAESTYKIGRQLAGSVGRLRPRRARAGRAEWTSSPRVGAQYPKENANVGALVDRLGDEVASGRQLLIKALFRAAACVC